MTGPLQIRSDGNGGTISGDLHLDKGRFQLGRASAAAARAAAQRPRNRARRGGRDRGGRDLHPWKLDLKLAGSDLQVAGLGINSHWTTNLQIGGLADAPRFTGRADLVHGDYDFAGRIFRLDRGTIRFRGESPPDPLLDIHAEAQVQGLDASVIVTGTGPQARDHLRQHRRRCRRTSCCRASCSAPRSPTCRRPKRCSSPRRSPRSSPDRAASTRSTRSRRAIGLDRLRIVPADVATGQKTAIAAGKYITRKLFVEVVTDGQGYSATQRRISDDPLAFAAVDGVDHRPVERERPGQQGLLANVRFSWRASVHRRYKRPASYK